MLHNSKYKTAVINLANSDFDIDLYHQSLALRRRVLAEDFGWELVELGALETDQYDTLFSHHIVALDGDTVVATLRLMPTNIDLFGVTYMILDAHRGHLPDMPRDILPYEIMDPHTWEASRLAICKSTPTTERNTLLATLLNAAREFISTQGGTCMLGMMHPIFQRVLSNIGIDVSIIGPVRDQKDGKICVLKYDF
jgi:N-acyl-L-homoserine lactone synthetase